jgi:DNA invertase Pin-like site-specific DNA recombinase
LIAKLDRHARNVAFVADLMDSDTEFVACDSPRASRLVLHILAAVGEAEREMIRERTRAALAAAKARGVRLGLNDIKLAAENHRNAVAYGKRCSEALFRWA